MTPYTGKCDVCGQSVSVGSLADFTLWVDFHLQCSNVGGAT